MNLSPERIVSRYCHLNPKTDRVKLHELLSYEGRPFRWSGADLIHATTVEGNRRMVVIENNSCPSGQKSMPLLDDHQEEGGYRRLVERTFLPYVKKRQGGVRVDGHLAVIYDKNPMETTGYAAVIADVFNEKVLLITDYDEAPERNLKVENDLLYAHVDDAWVPLRAAFRYVTPKPWTWLPPPRRTNTPTPTAPSSNDNENINIAFTGSPVRMQMGVMNECDDGYECHKCDECNDARPYPPLSAATTARR